jgi:amino acid transporter
MADADLVGKDDVEKYANHDHEKVEPRAPPSYDRAEQMRRGSVTSYHEGFFSAFTLQSFKRNPNARVVSEATDSEGRPLKDQPPAEPALAMKLKQRHLQMIAIGGSIGIHTHSLYGESGNLLT